MPEHLTGTERIAAERQRQMEVEGWTWKHDDLHDHGEIALAAIAYASPLPVKVRAHVTKPCGCRSAGECTHISGELQWVDAWPWEQRWWKPDPDRIRNLVKAGALIAAEIDRLERLKSQNASGGEAIP